MYGLYPRKGSIMVGADADIAIWDPDKKVTLSQDLMQHGSDYTPYEGMEVTGWPIKTLLRGTLIADDGKIVGEPGMGQFQARQTTQKSGKRLVYPLARAATHGNAHLLDPAPSEENPADRPARPASSPTCPKGSVALEEGGPDTGEGFSVGVTRVRIVHPVVSRPVR